MEPALLKVEWRVKTPDFLLPLVSEQQSQPTATKLQADTRLKVVVPVNILLIDAVINRNQNMTQVKVETAESVLKRIALELTTTDPS